MFPIGSVIKQDQAGHSRLEHYPFAVFQLQNDPLAYAMDGNNRLSFHPPAKGRQTRMNQDRLQSRAWAAKIADPATDYGCDSPAHGFHFGKFWH
jgi:hypothetical protein